MARQESCCFTGHRPEKLPWGEDEQDPRCLRLKERIADAVDIAYAQGYRHFICGMARGCDFYFGEYILALRKEHSDITLEAAIPCPTQARHWQVWEQERYDALLSACDLQIMVSQHYHPGCMHRRDRYMVDHSSLLIAAFNGTPGGTSYTMEYAMKQGIDIIDLHIEDLTD